MLKFDPQALGVFCAKHAVKTLYMFGSALTDAFDSDSDVDLLFEPIGSSPSYFEQMNMTDELSSILGRPVDLISRRAIEESTNGVRKSSILREARIIFPR